MRPTRGALYRINIKLRAFDPHSRIERAEWRPGTLVQCVAYNQSDPGLGTFVRVSETDARPLSTPLQLIFSSHAKWDYYLEPLHPLELLSYAAEDHYFEQL